MTKKARTGLQSRISHIFSGVPIPKKSHHDSAKGDTQPKPAESNNLQMPVEADDSTVDWKTEPPADIEKLVAQEPVKELQYPEPAIVEQPKIKPASADRRSLDESKVYKPDVEQNLVPQISADSQLTLETESTPDISQENIFVKTQPKTPVGVPALGTVKKTIPSRHMKATSRPKGKARRSSPADASQTRQKVMLVAVIGLAILLVFLLFNPFKVSSQNVNLSGSTEPASVNVAGGTDVVAIAVNWPVPPNYPADIHDPMNANSDLTAEQQTLKPKLTGIVKSEDRSLAIYGTQLLAVGEQIDGWTVIEINEGYVLLEKDGQKWTEEVQNEKNK